MLYKKANKKWGRKQKGSVVKFRPLNVSLDSIEHHEDDISGPCHSNHLPTTTFACVHRPRTTRRTLAQCHHLMITSLQQLTSSVAFCSWAGVWHPFCVSILLLFPAAHLSAIQSSSFAKSCSICLLPPVGLPLIRPSVTSHKRLLCFKTWPPIH